MTTVYAPGAKVTDAHGGVWDIGDVGHPDAVTVRTTRTAKRSEDPFTRWAQDHLGNLTVEERKFRAAHSSAGFDAAVRFSVPAEPPAPKAAKVEQPGNRERETVFRTVAAVERALQGLPYTHAQVAGFLQAKGYAGDVSAEKNALARYLADEAWKVLNASEASLSSFFTKVQVWVESNGTIVESPAYQVALNPMPWQPWFIERLRAGDFPALVQ